MDDGRPCRSISASSVVTAASVDLVQRCVSQPGASRAASTNAEENDDTVGLSTLIIMRALPCSRPTAACSIATERLNPYKILRTLAIAGCGSIATTRAPTRPNEP